MLARYVTSKGEKEQMENVDSAPTAKEAPGIFQTKRRRGSFFFFAGGFVFLCWEDTATYTLILLYAKFMEQPKGGANLDIRRVVRCDIIEAGG